MDEQDSAIAGWQTLTEAVQQTVGHASVCWVGGTGDAVFDESEAIKASETLINWISLHYKPID